MLTKRIISILLAVLMLMSAFSVATFATDGASAPKYTYNTSNATPTMNYISGTTIVPEGQEATIIDTPEEKLATMDLRFEKDGYQIYVDAYSGEVAVKSTTTDDILFTNPYNVGSSDVNFAIKKQLLSQLVVKFTNIKTDASETFYSFADAIQGEGDTESTAADMTTYTASQITVKNIKNGIRVEYSIGREQSKMLVPEVIEKTSFEKRILEPLKELVEQGEISQWDYELFTSELGFYQLYEPDENGKVALPSGYTKVRDGMSVYILDGKIKDIKKSKLEQIIKDKLKTYTYEMLDEDHINVGHESKDSNPPLFRMALEYTLDEYGLSVRLPANGIRFNESLYRLDNIEILPYMGAGQNPNTGATFYPDGSGALFDFEEIAKVGSPMTVTSKVYGQDYAYHTITGTHQEIIRYPVFGLYENQVVTEKVPIPKDPTLEDEDEEGEEAEEDVQEYEEVTVYERKRGYIAIVEEGDALMELSAYHAVRTHPYNTVKMTVYPRPQDTYNMAEAISVGANTPWTVVSSRKYAGNYKVRYIMLTDEKAAQEKNISDFYTCNYVGMAQAYRDYLERTGVITRLTEQDVKEDIPVYIETFGAIETTKRVLSIPVSTMAPLTSFEDLKTMYGELSAKGVSNINFILTGYTKGGMTEASYPYGLKWDKAVGGNDGFEDLVSYAKEKEFGIFPDFDFVFISNNTAFDGVTLKKHAVKTIDNRYTSKREYSATKQTYVSYFELAMSPAYYSRFYEKFTENYLKYDPVGISVSTLGSQLNSDFDEDEPYNRADSKQFTVEAFKYLDQKYQKVMTSSANAYAWQYVDYIVDAALDSSHYAQASASIPFLGMVLHGYVEFAGTPINMEGNINYALLKAVENGASVNFILSYQNTDILKNTERLHEYYSVRYDIWFDDLVDIYTELNGLLKDVQTSRITDHVFVDGYRVPDKDELLRDARQELEDAIKYEEDALADKIEETRKTILEGRQYIESSDFKATVDHYKTLLNTRRENILKPIQTAKAAYDAAKAIGDKAAMANALVEMRELIAEEQGIYFMTDAVVKQNYQVASEYETLTNYWNCIQENRGAVSDEIYALLEAKMSEIDTIYAEITASDLLDLEGIKAEMDDLKNNYKIDGAGIRQDYEIPARTNDSNVKEPENNKEDPREKYAADDCKIVYVEYENGTAFLLNFNNYAVTADYNEITYTIPTYGYVVLKK
ncbi:MAG: hypothetical protein E7679_04645 [Ruminococcaceae bacterium]|nr:hypothetical protein [Oscillospiraceae bacterium]